MLWRLTNAELNSDMSSQDSQSIRSAVNVRSVAQVESGDDSSMLIIIVVCAVVGLVVMMIGVRFVFASSKSSDVKNRVVPDSNF